jgi:hypothetical protein
VPFALEETTARTISEMERLKFLMFERGNLGNLGFPDCQVSLRNFSGMQEIVRLFLHRRDLFCAFLDLPKMHSHSQAEAKIHEASSIVRRLF